MVGAGEKGTGFSREDSRGIGRVLLYQRSVTTGSVGVFVRSPMVLLDEISGGCSRLPRQHTVSSAGRVGHPRPHVAVRPGGQAASPMPKETPTPGSPVPCVF